MKKLAPLAIALLLTGAACQSNATTNVNPAQFSQAAPLNTPAKAFAKYDDNQSSYVSLSEFVNGAVEEGKQPYVPSPHGPSFYEWLQGIFYSSDTDRDNQLNQTEFERAYRQI